MTMMMTRMVIIGSCGGIDGEGGSGELTHKK